MKTIFTTCLLFVCLTSLHAQSDTEFPKGFVMYMKLHNGVVSKWNQSPDLYVGGLQLVPMFTVAPHVLRAGVIADVFYTGKKMQAAVGPTVAIKLKSFNAGAFGSAGNLHLALHHLWGTGKQQLLGAGLNADILNKLLLGVTVDRDYYHNNWWLQTAIGIRISKKKKTAEPFN